MKVLIIDDDIVVHELSARLLEIVDNDCTVVSSYNGQQGLDFLKTNQASDDLPDIILLDLRMPVLDGWEFLKEFKKTIGINYNPSIFILSEQPYQPEDVKGFPIKGGYMKPLNFSSINQIMLQASA
jgi:CheY-like chemotaxis protein